MVPWHRLSVYNTVAGSDTLDAMFVDDDSMGLNTNDAKRSCAVWKVLVVCAGGKVVCILIIVAKSGCRARKNIYQLCKLESHVHTGHSLVCIAVATFSKGRLLLPARCGCGSLSMHGGSADICRHECRLVLRHWIAGESVLACGD